ncbi:MAG: hypothetical protein FD155_270 [Bacteroidetes bacterium]|nr:MAG: hypothetical protein FD155_270 [Bacteroidota bacterium]
MKLMIKHLLAALLLLTIISSSSAQQEEKWTLTAEEVEQYKSQSRALVAYFEGTLNFLGDERSTAQEKEIIIEESYAKIFVNEDVQIEDDLDENREVPINKNVQAYLKDVDFFFQSAVFSFDVQSVEPMVGENGMIFFKVTFMRRLDAVLVNNDSIKSNRIRYMEINLDPFKKDLKIASYYTSKINEQEELRQWWNAMPLYWKDIFGRDAVVFDTLLMADIEAIGNDTIVIKRNEWIHRKGIFYVAGTDTIPEAAAEQLHNRPPDTVLTLDDHIAQMKYDSLAVNLSAIDNRLKQISSMKTLDISFNFQVVSLEPVSQLNELEEINFSNTPVNDVSPLRNLSKLKTLFMSSSLVRDLTPLQYATNIEEVYIHDTDVEDITTLEHFRNLKKIYCFNTGIRNLSPVATLTQLTILKAGNTLVEDLQPLSKLVNIRILDLSQTLITDIQALEPLVNLQQLNIDKTLVKDLSPLRKMSQLNLLQCSETKVSDLSPLEGLESLTRVYTNKNEVKPSQATNLMRIKPGLLVVFDSEELEQWWNNLPIYWRALLTEQAGIGSNPTTEDLHQVINISKLDLSGNSYLQHMEPVNRLANLQELSISRTEITELDPLKGLHNLQKINISQTRISQIEALRGLFQLEELNIESTRVDNLDALHAIGTLQLLKADKSRITHEVALKLKQAQPKVLIIYQTEKLQFWWNNLDEEWKKILMQDLIVQPSPDPVQLQTIADRTELLIENNLVISNLEPLMPLLMLEKLVLKGSQISDFNPLKTLSHLKYLDLSGNPLSDLSPVAQLSHLEFLSIESTPVIDLSALSKLGSLQHLNISGTQIKSLKSLANLLQLSELSVYNTRIRSLSPADKLPALKHVKCYNTKISKKTIEKLKQARPEINILYY